MTSKAILHQPEFPEAAPVPLAQAGSRALWLSRLSLSRFRNYAVAELSVDGRPVVLSGPNGAGKTNLLEAISYLAPGRGLRRARLFEVERRVAEAKGLEPPGAAAWTVAARVMTPEGLRELGTGREPGGERNGNGATEPGRERRLVRIDGSAARSQQELGEILSIVWLTPQMDGLFRDGASARRRFLDRLVYGFDPAHAGRVSAYGQALSERARLLKGGHAEDAWLSALEETMASLGVAIAASRRDLVARLDAACAKTSSPFPVAGLALAGEVEGWLAEGSALAAEEELRRRLAEARPHDAHAGGAAIGPHKSDLEVTHRGGNLPAALCSTGEQKALLLSVVLAHARLLGRDRGTAPLLLLDEVAAHLDEARRRALFEEILGLGGQAWLTGTEAGLFAPLGEAAQFVEVRAATLNPVAPPVWN